MQFAIGFLSCFCVILVITVVWYQAALRKMLADLFFGLGEVTKGLAEINKTVASLPASTQNIIHLGIKPGEVKTGVGLIKLPINPKDFEVRADKLREKLFHGLEIKAHPDTGTHAYVILDHAGLFEIMEGNSAHEVRRALTRLLANGDDATIRNFLETLADSVAAATISAISVQTSVN